jgi:hypothetical protein
MIYSDYQPLRVDPPAHMTRRAWAFMIVAVALGCHAQALDSPSRDARSSATESLNAGQWNGNCQSPCANEGLCCSLTDSCNAPFRCCIAGGQPCVSEQCCWGSCTAGQCGCGPTSNLTPGADYFTTPCKRDEDCCSGSCRPHGVAPGISVMLCLN